MIRKAWFTRKSIAFTWLISYIIILAIPLLVSTCFFLEAERIVQGEIQRSNGFILHQIQREMDHTLRSAEVLYTEICLNFNIQKAAALSSRGAQTPDEKYTVYKAIQDLYHLKVANATVESSVADVYVYLIKPDRILTASVNGSSADMHKYFYPNDTLAYEAWDALLRRNYPKNYITMPYISQTGATRKGIVYARSLPVIWQEEVVANIFVLLDESKFLQYAEDVRTHSEEMLLVVDREDNVIASNSDGVLPETLRYAALPERSGTMQVNVGDRRMVATSYASEVANWKYVYLTPSSVLWEKAHALRTVTVTGLLLCLGIGGVLAHYLAKRNYQPMLNLIKTLEKGHRGQFSADRDEYSFIHQVFSRMTDAQNEFISRLEQQNKVLRDRFLARLLKGHASNDMLAVDSLAAHDIRFLSDRFTVMLVYINDAAELRGPRQRLETIEHYETLQFIIKNVLEELLNQRHYGFVAEVDGMMGCLLNDCGEHPNVAQDEARRIAEEAQTFLKAHCKISVAISISGTHETTACIHQAYGEALAAMEYRMVLGAEEIIAFHDVDRSSQNAYTYPLEKEQQLINCIKTGDFDSAQAHVRDVFNENADITVLSVQMAQCFFFDLVSTVIKAIGEVGAGTLMQESNYIAALFRCETIPDMQGELLRVLRETCTFVQRQYANERRDIRQEAIAFVERHYSDCDLSISMLGKHLELAPYYASKLFKEQTGEGLLEYINRVRIQKAKEIMSMRSLTIEELAEAVGFFSSRTFARTFKKIEGITPGKYKEIPSPKHRQTPMRREGEP